MTQKEAEAMSVVELKAAIYDQIAILEMAQANIKSLNMVLGNKPKEEKKGK